jgi:alkanesulfonate monooxygenase SsuD/methylene tetrahydromethanopterin reductase-like flavin-dependent oxidoreductase (luciferase family)
VKLHFFHLMPYRLLPSDFSDRYRSVWVDIPRDLYDPVEGHGLYHEYLDELLLAEELGFDGICVNEHHQNGYGTMPSPNVMAAILARTTSRAAILVLGNSIALYNPPTRVAEEMAMLDVLSGGRLIAGFPVGTPQDTCVCYGMNPATIRDRYREAHDLIIRAWKEEKPFAFNGEFTKLRYVNIWPRTLQQPRPPVWIPSGSSVETWDFALQNDYVMCYLSFTGWERAALNIDGYWRRAAELGVDDNPYRLGFIQTVLVGEDDADAERSYGEHVQFFYNKCLHTWPGFVDLPGYRSIKSIKAGLIAWKPPVEALDLSWQDLIDNGSIIAGGPETVRQRLREAAERLRVGQLMLLLQVGSMPPHLVEKNTRLFMEEVAPHVRDLWGDYEDRWSPRPILNRYGTAPGAGRASGDLRAIAT